ncbi:DUF4328 domain-containing protein [Streptomyces albipurpureus]|uniref:DUF4328 domain-containing protein n=1 Tax=Streptomyces albipurpureus TaxID=2897419 RepID=A0ABT0UGD8_9ACTN|nr:DUF4328 domain-containing protein [Streptomyces sp. CWNU-1]MCM2387495.1 DUF4328 domain-containing protein [Streptomyces sp. CWNU-1]
MPAPDKLRPRPQLPAQVVRLPRGLLIAVTGLLAVAALGGVFGIYAGVRTYLLAAGGPGFSLPSEQEWDRVDALHLWAERLQYGAFPFCAILFIMWFHRMRRNAGAFAPEQFRRGPGWAIGAWFIPLAQVWLPFRIAIDIWSASAPSQADGKPVKATFWPVFAWWGLFLLSNLVNTFARQRSLDAETLQQLQDAALQMIVADVLDIGAAAAAVYFVVRLTSRQRSKMAEGSHRAA